MDPTDLRQILLVRAFETPPGAPSWTVADGRWAADEATRAEGESGPAEHWIARRARLASARLAERDVGVASALAASGEAPRWIDAALLLLALAGGIAIDRIGDTQRVDILAPPLLALLLWNLVVYALLALHALRGRDAPMLPRSARFARPRPDAPPDGSPLARFAAEWTRLRRPLLQARLQATLHAAAALFAAGALASLYLRGLVLEYRAGWDSTFLSADTVHGWLSVMLGPAAALAGIELPGPEQLDALRFSRGGGENAARWIHLHALTIALGVVLPRAALAAYAYWRWQWYAARPALDLDEPYFRHLLARRGGQPAAVRLLPYSYTLPGAARARLQDLLEDELHAPVALTLAEPVPQGDEERLEQRLPAPADGAAEPAALVALFALTATPEHETHGAFVDALAVRLPPAARLLVLVDESGFRRRFGEAADAAARLEQRRAAWQRLLLQHGSAPLFVDLERSA